MKNKLKVGIVGAPRGQSFIRSFQAIEETDVIAICDLKIDVVEGIASQFNIAQKLTSLESSLCPSPQILFFHMKVNRKRGGGRVVWV